MSKPSIASDLLEAADTESEFASEVSLDSIVFFKQLSHLGSFRFGQITHPSRRQNACVSHEFLRAGQADAVDVGKRVFDSFVAWQIHARYTCQTLPPSLEG